MTIRKYRMQVTKGVSGVENNRVGLQIQFLEADEETAAEIFDEVDFRAEFAPTTGDAARLVALTESDGVTVDRGSGDITVTITASTFNDVKVPDFQSREGRFSVGHAKTDGTRRIIASGPVYVKDSLYVSDY